MIEIMNENNDSKFLFIQILELTTAASDSSHFLFIDSLIKISPYLELNCSNDLKKEKKTLKASFLCCRQFSTFQERVKLLKELSGRIRVLKIKKCLV